LELNVDPIKVYLYSDIKQNWKALTRGRTDQRLRRSKSKNQSFLLFREIRSINRNREKTVS